MSPVYLGQMPGPSHSRLSNISRHCHAPSSPLVQGDVSCLVIVEGPGFRRNRGNWIKRIHYHCEGTPNRTPVSLSLFRERVVREEILQIRIRLTERERGIRVAAGRMGLFFRLCFPFVSGRLERRTRRRGSRSCAFKRTILWILSMLSSWITANFSYCRFETVFFPLFILREGNLSGRMLFLQFLPPYC